MAFLAGAEAAYVTGQVIAIDGGFAAAGLRLPVDLAGSSH